MDHGETASSHWVRHYEVRPSDPEAARELGRACGVGATMAQVLLHRGLSEADKARAFLDPRLSELTPPHGMADREKAAERLADAIRRKERIAVFGDYDVDGTTSAAIVAGILEHLGAEVVAFVANRFEGGYGFSLAAWERCRAANPSLIVTCDCGSTDHERIAIAMRHGIDVIVLDHHLVPSEPLPAYAFLNPHRPDCEFPYKGLSSAGLALLLGALVRSHIGVEMDLRKWLDLVAVGTIADVAPLDGDNRRLVRAGLQRLHERPGLAALCRVARLHRGLQLGAIDVAFRLAPRLNAAGRLGDPSITLSLLRARTNEEADHLASQIEALNEKRKRLERQVTEAAFLQVESIYGSHPQSGIVVAGEGWHRGVVGITAARLVDRYGVPAIVVANEHGVGHGSCRAPDGFPLYDAVSMCKNDLIAFGGHHCAAGLTIESPRIEMFRASFIDATHSLQSQWHIEKPAPIVDVEVDGVAFPIPSAEDRGRLEPIGEANVDPLFALQVQVEEQRAVGESHLKLGLRAGAQRFSAFGRDMGALAGSLPNALRVLGHLRRDLWRGGTAMEISISQLAR